MTGIEKISVIGKSGLSGWALSPDDLESYRDSVEQAWGFWSRLWQRAFFRPSPRHRIAYSRPGGGVSIVTPSEQFMALLRRGGLIRHMRVIDHHSMIDAPVFEGSGEIMGPMTEREALEFVAWKDVPRGTNHIAIIKAGNIPDSRTHRDSWRLSDDGQIMIN